MIKKVYYDRLQYGATPGWTYICSIETEGDFDWHEFFNVPKWKTYGEGPSYTPADTHKPLDYTWLLGGISGHRRF